MSMGIHQRFNQFGIFNIKQFITLVYTCFRLVVFLQV